MAKNKHLGIRVEDELHYKLSYIAEYEGRSINGQVIYLINQCIRNFEKDSFSQFCMLAIYASSNLYIQVGSSQE